MTKLSRCQTNSPIPNPNNLGGHRVDEFTSAHYDLTLTDDGTLVVRGSEAEVKTSAAWWIEAEAPKPAPSAPVAKAAPTKKGGK